MRADQQVLEYWVDGRLTAGVYRVENPDPGVHLPPLRQVLWQSLARLHEFLPLIVRLVDASNPKNAFGMASAKRPVEYDQ